MSENDLQLRMSIAEATALNELLKASNCYLEWGCGGSTLAAVRSKPSRMVSIESDKSWLDRIREYPEIRSALEHQRLTLRHVDIGKVGSWGMPLDQDRLRYWPMYALDPFISTDIDFDLILVDGRFRVHCLLAAANCVKDNAVIFFHDYNFGIATL